MSHDDRVIQAQSDSHGEGFDYDKGSPHLRHPQVRAMVDARLSALVREQIASTGRCRVLEIGGGHGTFTQTLLDAGAEVTVTETSSASAAALESVFGDDSRVQVVYDATGDSALSGEPRYELVVLVSVVHHIPDYLTFIDAACGLLVPGGSFLSIQDPLYYPRMSSFAHRLDRGLYLAWRVFQGNYRRGLSTRLRRLRGIHDEAQPSDLVEYHVVRDGVDEVAIRDLLAPQFSDVEILPYWTCQAPAAQRIGERLGALNTFSLAARTRLASQ